MTVTLINKREVGAIVSLHPEVVMRLSRNGEFPVPIKLRDSKCGPVRFVKEEVETWLAKRLAARSEQRAESADIKALL